MTITPAIGDVDTIVAGNGFNSVLGGIGGDVITGGIGRDVVVGDNGNVTFNDAGILTYIETSDAAVAGAYDDVIDVVNGSDVVLGGNGYDLIDAGTDTADDVVVGDNGHATFTDRAVLTDIASTDTEIGNHDLIVVGDGDNVVIGGVGEDVITGGNGNDVVVGDNGHAVFTVDGILTDIVTTAPDVGAHDELNVLDGNNVVIAGVASDSVTGGNGSDVVVGDNGHAHFNDLGVLISITTITPEIGDVDTIVTGNGFNAVLGGIGGDLITGGSDRDVVVGDNGNATFNDDGILTYIETSDSAVAGAYDDVIHAVNGSDVVLGGNGFDQIDAGTDNAADVVLGDNGHATFTGAGILTDIASTETAVGNPDQILVGDGNNVVIGGVGEDIITGGSGNDVVLGDNGHAVFTTAGILIDAITTAPDIGAHDEISVLGGNNVVIGGLGSDTITGGNGSDVVVGDNGHAHFNDLGVLTSITTITPAIGDVDIIVTGNGFNSVLGGIGGDVITGGTGRDVVVGDNGNATFNDAGILTYIETSDAAVTGAYDDVIDVVNGSDVVLGGNGYDQIDAGTDTADDVVVGDNGHATFTDGAVLTDIASTETAIGDHDQILVGDGNNVVIGGVGEDVITGGNGNDVVLGDNGHAVFTVDGILTDIVTTAPDVGAHDELNVLDGNNVVIGGVASDTIAGGAGSDVVVGDNGHAHFNDLGVLTFITTITPEIGNVDTIVTGNGSNTVLGGIGGDLITGGTGRDVVVGDNGNATFNDAGILTYIETSDVTVAGAYDDVINAVNGSDAVLGGNGYDQIDAGTDNADDVVVGDNGRATFTDAAVLTDIASTDTAIGNHDLILVGAGNNVVIGGVGEDVITGGNANDVVLGDNGHAVFTVDGILTDIVTTAPDIGAHDEINVLDGNNVVIGGVASDTITGGAGSDVVVGDNGHAHFNDLGVLTFITTITPEIGDVDAIVTGDGFNAVFGGIGGDAITGGINRDVVVGDNGNATFNDDGILTYIETSDAAIVGAYDDVINAANGSDVVLGGNGYDQIDAGTDSADDVVVGDNGHATFTATGVLIDIESTDTAIGDHDKILVGDGSNVVIGGVGKDLITGGNNNDVVLGDHGHARFNNAGVLTFITTTSPVVGDVDTIVTGNGFNTVLGGIGGDLITGGINRDVVVGDNGNATFNDAGILTYIETSDAAVMGAYDDVINAVNGSDVVLGGNGYDQIDAGTDSADDVVVGDNGHATFTDAAVLTNIASTDTAIGNHDLIQVGAGNNVVIGGVGEDVITGGNGNDVVLGDNGHAAFTMDGILTDIVTTAADIGAHDEISVLDGNNVVIGGVASDTITGGAGSDVVVGDNGHAHFNDSGVLTFITTITPEIGDVDTIVTGNSFNTVLGGIGGDLITGGIDQDIVVGDNGNATFNDAGILTYIETSDAAVTGAYDDVINAVNGSDVVLGGNGYDQIDAGTDSADDVVVGDNGHATFTASGVLIDIASTDTATGDHDKILVGDGNNVVIGGVGKDLITGGNNNNVVLGDNGHAQFNPSGVLIFITTTSPEIGDVDSIATGDGFNVVLGGMGGDLITGGKNRDIVLGDNGNATFNNDAVLVYIETSDAAVDGSYIDGIDAGKGSDVVFGGNGADSIEAGGDTASDVVVGDNGNATFTAFGELILIQTASPSIGGDDVIVTGAGNNVVLGGAGNDSITTGAGDDIVLGDNGYIDYVIRDSNPADLDVIASTDIAIGGVDTITTGAGSDIVIGGQAGDTITAGTGNNIVIGDSGIITGANEELHYFSSQPLALGRIESTAFGVGGIDTITTLGGQDIILGGFDGDLINAGDGNNLVLGDDGSIDYTAAERGYAADSAGDDLNASDIDRIVSTSTTQYGGVDVIDSGSGDDLIIGGRAGDTLRAGEGNNVVMGDSGQILAAHADTSRFGALPVTLGLVATTEPGDGGIDAITTLRGQDIILGGFEGDLINAGDGNNLVLGDDGSIDYTAAERGYAAASAGDDLNALDIDRIVSTSTTQYGGVDVIDTGSGDDLIIGGRAGDTLRAGEGNNLVMGDSGQILAAQADTSRFGALPVTLGLVATTEPADGGDDQITTGAGRDIVLGGFALDTISAGDGDNIILADNGAVDYVRAERDPLALGADTNPADIDVITSIDFADGGADTITSGNGHDIVIGGQANDTIVAGNGANIVIGDSGIITAATEDAHRFMSQPMTVGRIETTAFGIGGTDTITTGVNNDVVLGGHAADIIHGSEGDNLVLGDNGAIDYVRQERDGAMAGADTDASDIDLITSSSTTANGGADQIDTGSGNDIVIGGRFGDTITAVGGNNIVLGDSGTIIAANANTSRIGSSPLTLLTVGQIKTTEPGDGATDTIKTGVGRDIIFGGTGGDMIAANVGETAGTPDGDNIVLGDDGAIDYVRAEREPTALGGDTNPADIDLITSLDFADGGVDIITTGNGLDIVIGGQAGDTIVAGNGVNIVMGDSGIITATTEDAHRLVSQPITVGRIETTAFGIGGADTITTGVNNDVVLGGHDADIVHGSEGDNLVLGDDGAIDYVRQERDGVVLGADTDASDIDVIVSLSTIANGGADQIDTGSGNDIVIGGRYADTVTDLGGSNIVIGDSGMITAANGITPRLGSLPLTLLTVGEFKTIEVGDGGADTINGGSGTDIILGGAGGDTLSGNGGRDIILGDNGKVDYLVDGNAATLDTFSSTDPTIGGNENISGGDDNDIVFGGTGDDTISGGNGSDILLGDHGLVDYSFPANQVFKSIFTDGASGAGNDTIHGDAGDDFILGQQGNDTLYGDAGDDDMTGGHNVVGGVDGNDTMDGGDGSDVMLGENGISTRTVLGDTLWKKYLAPFTDVIREVVRFDDIDLVTGNDTMLGGAGNDVIHGQRGDDTLDGGDGDDEVYGELGNDNGSGGAGADILIGEVGTLVRAFNTDGTPRVDANGSWHKDVFLEEVGVITGMVHTDTTPLRNLDPDLARKILSADLVVLGGSVLPDGLKLQNSDTGAWATDILLVDLMAASNDTLNGGDGDDILFGQRGNDTLNGGANNDLIFGDGATNVVPFVTNLPQIVNGVRLLSIAPGTDAPIQLAVGGSVIVPNMTLRADEYSFVAPGITFVPKVVPAFNAIASSDALTRTDGALFVAYASIIPDIVHHVDMMPGNDVIDGGTGADMIFGDDTKIYAPLFTGLLEIERATQDVAYEMNAILYSLHYLALDYDLYEHTVLGTGNGPHDIRYGNDVINGGDGDDLIGGDDGVFQVPFMVGLPVEDANFTAAALKYHNFLRDMEHVAFDFLNLAEEAHGQVLNALVADAVAHNPKRVRPSEQDRVNPDFHDLFVGNDVINGGAGNDIITGDDMRLLMPVMNGDPDEFAQHYGNISVATWTSTQTALSAQQRSRDDELDAHLKADHVGLSGYMPRDADLALIPYDFEYDLNRGNDVILGGTGDDLMTGDYSLFVVPIVLAPSQSNKWWFQGSDWFDHHLFGNGAGWFSHDWFKSAFTAKNDWFDKGNGGDWVQHHNEWLDFDVYQFFQENHNHQFWKDLGKNFFGKHFLTHHLGRQGFFASVRNLYVSIGNDSISGEDGNDVVLADNLALVAPYGPASSAPSGGTVAPYFRSGLLAGFGFILKDPNHAGLLDVAFSDTISGGNGNDVLLGQQGVDSINGGLGNDQLFGGAGRDTLVAGGGTDTLRSGGSGSTRSTLNLLQGLFLSSMTPIFERLLLDIAATGGVLSPSGDVLKPAIDSTIGTIFDRTPASTLTVGIVGVNAAVTGQPLVFNGVPNAVSDQMQWRVLDSANQVILVGTGPNLSFAPKVNGTYRILFGAANSANAIGIATLTLQVTTFLVQADVANPGKSILLIGGTTNGDKIELKQGSTLGSVRVTIDDRDKDTVNFDQTYSNLSQVQVYGGMGDDEISVNSNVGTMPVILDGGPGNDKLTGGNGNDILRGGFGEDELNGGNGDDLLDGGKDNDKLDGGNGNDTLIGADGNDDLHGGAGNDNLDAGNGNDTLDGDEGDDVINGGSGEDVLIGDAGRDQLNGGDGNDSLNGGADDDVLNGGNGNDVLIGGDGNDTLSGGAGNDLLDSGKGDDILWGDEGDDTLLAGEGNDQLHGGTGNDVLHGDNGNDTLWGDEGDDRLEGGNDNDILHAGGGNDYLMGGLGNDALYGEGGDDVLSGGGGTDTYDGGSGANLQTGQVINRNGELSIVGTEARDTVLIEIKNGLLKVTANFSTGQVVQNYTPSAILHLTMLLLAGDDDLTITTQVTQGATIDGGSGNDKVTAGLGAKFDAGEVRALLPRATVVMGVPTFYTRLLALPSFGAADCRNVRLFISGSAPLLAHTFDEFKLCTGQAVLERYGMTETGMITSNPLAGERIGGTVGPALPGVSLRVVDRTAHPCSAGEIGNIEVKGPNVFAGYWRKSDQAREAFTADGYFRTGDVGELLANDYLRIVGRAKDLVITGGLNVYPKEVEERIDAIAGVLESAVIGVPHADFGEAVVAVIAVPAGHTLTEAGVIAALKAEIASFKVPKRVHFVRELPRNAMGKVQKNVLRERFAKP